MRYRRKIPHIMAASALTCALVVTPVYAEPSGTVSDLQSEQADLEDQKAGAQSELNSLQAELEDLVSRITELEDDLVQTGQEIEQAEKDLDAAEEKRQEQYDAMKLRIRYMYESGGDVAAIEKVLSSGDITNMLTQAEYSQKVHEYDREQLKAYAETVQEITDLEQTLETEMADLQDMEAEFQEQQDTLSSTIASKQDEISDLDGMIREAARRVLEQQEQERQEQEAAQAGQNEETQGAEDDSGQNGGEDSGDREDTGDREDEEPQDTPDYDTVVGGSIVSRAKSALGKPYKWGQAGPDSFDCSGLVSFAVSGRYSHLWSTGDIINWTPVSDPQPGDICIRPGHCGVYIGNGRMIHAPSEGDVVKEANVQAGMFYVRY